MVYALEKAHSLIKPGGFVLDIMEIPEHRWIGYQYKDKVTKVDKLVSRLKFEDVYKGRAAITNVVNKGLFSIEEELEIESNIYTDSLEEMREYTTSKPAKGEETFERLAQIMDANNGEAMAAYIQEVRLLRLKAENY